jgi:hypothetical protein
MEIKKVVLDLATGEILDELHDGDSIRRKSQDDYYNKKKKLICMEDNGNFVKIFNKIISTLGEEELTANEYKICLRLLEFIEYESGILKYSNNGRELNTKDIADITGLCYKSVSRAMQTLVNKKIYGVHKTGKENCYTVNPFIFMKGKYVNKTLYDFYKKSKWATI